MIYRCTRYVGARSPKLYRPVAPDLGNSSLPFLRHLISPDWMSLFDHGMTHEVFHWQSFPPPWASRTKYPVFFVSGFASCPCLAGRQPDLALKMKNLLPIATPSVAAPASATSTSSFTHSSPSSTSPPSPSPPAQEMERENKSQSGPTPIMEGPLYLDGVGPVTVRMDEDSIQWRYTGPNMSKVRILALLTGIRRNCWVGSSDAHPVHCCESMPRGSTHIFPHVCVDTVLQFLYRTFFQV